MEWFSWNSAFRRIRHFTGISLNFQHNETQKLPYFQACVSPSYRWFHPSSGKPVLHTYSRVDQRDSSYASHFHERLPTYRPARWPDHWREVFSGRGKFRARCLYHHMLIRDFRQYLVSIHGSYIVTLYSLARMRIRSVQNVGWSLEVRSLKEISLP